jgi:serine/threonine protein kinase
MFILLAGYHPFDVHGDAIKSEVLRKIEKADFTYNDPVWDDVDPEAKQIINSLLQINSKDRITLAQFLDTHFVKRGPHRPELMADIMRRFDRMRSARDTVKSSSLAKLRLNRSVRAVYHECVRRRLISHGQVTILFFSQFSS